MEKDRRLEDEKVRGLEGWLNIRKAKDLRIQGVEWKKIEGWKVGGLEKTEG